MEQKKIDLFASTHREYFADSVNFRMNELLSNVSDDKDLIINSLPYKQPSTLLLFSIFLGGYGVDRFLLGDTAMGVLKLLTCGGCGIWTIIDWFSVQDKTKEYNFKLLQDALR